VDGAGASVTGARLPLRGLAFDAFTIFVGQSDDCLDPGEECPDEPRFPGRRVGAVVTVDPGQKRAATQRLTDAANSADESGWSEHRDALTRLASRVGPA